LSAQCRAQADLGAAAHAAGQQQIGNIGAGDHQDECGEDHEQAEVGRVMFLQVLDTSAAGRQHDMDFREQRLPFPGGKRSGLGKRVAHHGAQLLPQGGKRDARLQAADHV
jgi:hypothetical protein